LVNNYYNFMSFRRRSILPRAMAVVLCLAVIAAGMAHSAQGQAAEPYTSAAALMEAIDLAQDVGNDTDHAITDSCPIASVCHSWVAAAQSCVLWPPAGALALALTEVFPRDTTAALRGRPPKTHA
jgi:hypothetical protein